MLFLPTSPLHGAPSVASERDRQERLLALPFPLPHFVHDINRITIYSSISYAAWRPLPGIGAQPPGAPAGPLPYTLRTLLHDMHGM